MRLVNIETHRDRKLHSGHCLVFSCAAACQFEGHHVDAPGSINFCRCCNGDIELNDRVECAVVVLHEARPELVDPIPHVARDTTRIVASVARFFHSIDNFNERRFDEVFQFHLRPRLQHKVADGRRDCKQSPLAQGSTAVPIYKTPSPQKRAEGNR